MGSRKPRYCIIRQFYYDLQLRREAEALVEDGFDVDVICLQEGGHEKVETENGVRIFRVSLAKKRGSFIRYIWDYFAFLFVAGLKVTGLHLRHRYRAIQATSMPDFLVFATLFPRILGAKTVAFFKEPTPELMGTLYKSRMTPRVLRFLERISLRYANLVFTVTKQLKDVYVSRGTKARKIHVILNAPDARHLRDVVDISAFKPDQNYMTLIYHGSVEERYGHDVVLKAIGIARPKAPGVRFKILGTGEYVETVLRMIDELNLRDCVEYLGFVSRERLSEELAKADVGVVAQKSSPYSNLVHTTKMYEYMILGKPAIVSRLTSVAAYFDDRSLCFFEPDDPQSLAEAIIDLYQHPDKRRTLAENAQKLYQQYCWDKQREVYLREIRRLAGVENADSAQVKSEEEVQV